VQGKERERGKYEILEMHKELIVGQYERFHIGKFCINLHNCQATAAAVHFSMQNL
jgi:hypothetical protein